MSEQLERTVDFSAVLEPGLPGSGTYETTDFTKAHFITGSGSFHRVDTEKRVVQPLKKTLTSTGKVTGRQIQIYTPGMMVMGHNGSPADFRFGTILQLAGMEETQDVPNSRVDYKYRSRGFKTGAVSVYEDAVTGSGMIYPALGCVANITMTGRAGEEISITTDIRGTYIEPFEQAAPTVTYPPGGFIVHDMELEGLTLAINGGSTFTPVWKSFTLNWGWTIVERKDANAAKGVKNLRLTQRNPTLQLVIEQDVDINVELYQALAAGAAKYMTAHWIHGPGNGEQIEYTIVCEIDQLGKQAENDLRTFTVDTSLMHPNTDDAEFIYSAI